MISTADLYKELDGIKKAIEKEKDGYKQALLKSNELIIKLLHNIRTNMVLTMSKMGVEKVKNPNPRTTDEKAPEQE
jgi:hypothetical protein